MKLKIKKITEIRKTSIEGKVLDKITYYCVYRSFLFGMVKVYIRFLPSGCWEARNEVTVSYEPLHYASRFSEDEVKELLEVIKENPDKFVRYK